MSNVRITIDDSQVQAVFSALSARKQKKALMGGIRKSAQVLIKRTKQLIKANLKNTNKPNKWNGKPMTSGVKYKGDNEKLEGKVHIMGDFRLVIFEKGNYKSRPRKTKGRKKTFNGHYRGGRRQYNRIGKGHSTGNVKALYLFKQAKSDSEQQVFATLNDNIKESIMKAILRGRNRLV